MGSATVSESHAIIITDVDADTGKVYYSAHSTELMNRDLSKAFIQDNPEDNICIVKPYYSDGK